MSSKGGAREGAGRPPGATNKRSQAIADKLEELQVFALKSAYIEATYC